MISVIYFALCYPLWQALLRSSASSRQACRSLPAPPASAARALLAEGIPHRPRRSRHDRRPTPRRRRRPATNSPTCSRIEAWKSFDGRIVLQDVHPDVPRCKIVSIIGRAVAARHLDALHQPARAARRGVIALLGDPVFSGEPRGLPGPARLRSRRHGVPALQPLPAPDRGRERDAGPAQGPHDAGARGHGARRCRLLDASASPIARWPSRSRCPAASSTGRDRAGAGAAPDLLLFDEPTSSLDPSPPERSSRPARARRATA